ncbi:MAG: hypothetical protein ABI743_10455, partial [bacterium]
YAPESFFDGTVKANVSTVMNADAYWAPENLLLGLDTSANTYPYKLVVSDGGMSNRLDGATGAAISNGGVPTGNFDTTLGWQTLPSESWTGYDTLHQGQAARTVLRLRKKDIQYAYPFRFNFALVAKYCDPKSATPGIFHRLPASPPDLLGGFGYRYPHGALDVSKLQFDGESGEFVGNETSSTTLRFHVRDWDARATETAGALASDPVATHVAAGASGTPLLEVSIPGVLGSTVQALPNTPVDDDSLYGGDAGQDSGAAGDGLFYEGVINKTGGEGGATVGIRKGLVRATDVSAVSEGNLVNLTYDLFPVTGTVPVPITYQWFQVTVGTPLTNVGWARGFPPEGQQVGQRTWVDPAGDVYTVGTYNAPTDFGGGVRTPVGLLDVALIKLRSDGAYLWDHTWGTANDDYCFGLTGDATGETVSVTSRFYTTLQLAPDAPVWTSPSENIYIGTFKANGSWSDGIEFGGINSDYARDLVRDDADNYYVVGDIASPYDFGGGTRTPVGGFDAFVASYDSAFAYRWDAIGTGMSTTESFGIALVPSGDVVACGIYALDSIDWGGGARAIVGNQDGYVVRLDGDTGAYVWDHAYGGPGIDQFEQIAGGTSDQVVVGGFFDGLADYGAGPMGVGGWRSGLLFSLDSAGMLLWTEDYNNPTYSNMRVNDVVFPDGGDIFLFGDTSISFSLGGIDVTLNGGADAFLGRVHPADGSGVWGVPIGDLGNEAGFGLSYGGPDGELYVSGTFQAYPDGTADLRPGPEVFKVSGAEGGTHNQWFVSKLEDTGDW